MEILIIETREFSKLKNDFQKKRQLLESDYESLKTDLRIYPEKGDLIPGTGGVRKIRLASASKGKSGGFRVCYYYLISDKEIYLVWVYAKGEQENLTMEEKKNLKEIVRVIKG